MPWSKAYVLYLCAVLRSHNRNRSFIKLNSRKLPQNDTISTNDKYTQQFEMFLVLDSVERHKQRSGVKKNDNEENDKTSLE